MRRLVNFSIILFHFLSAFLFSTGCFSRMIFFLDWPTTYDICLFGFGFIILCAHYGILFLNIKKHPEQHVPLMPLCIFDGIVFGLQLLFIFLVFILAVYIIPLFRSSPLHSFIPVIAADVTFLILRFVSMYFARQEHKKRDDSQS